MSVKKIKEKNKKKEELVMKTIITKVKTTLRIMTSIKNSRNILITMKRIKKKSNMQTIQEKGRIKLSYKSKLIIKVNLNKIGYN